ncbi:hypothetical protein GCM10009789_51120 [Kribbella sancticallisti]|uniref:Uncharacterized protein n=1 Tax=Kribbella sancticallisti TaxID=460087 RepID=A0ABP4PTX7_9ACTN
MLMVGAEMLNWSDLHPVDGRAAAGGPAPAALMDAVLKPTDKVLVVGPHSLALLKQVAATVSAVDILVRSAPDAEQIAATIEGRVFCGAIDRFPETGLYDVVVALDGLPRLVGPDTATLSWLDALALLKARVAPRGRLLVAAANAFGVERLLQPDVTATVPRDEDWPRDLAGSVQPPPGLKAVTAALGMPAMACSVYPDLTEAQVALVDPTGPLTATTIARTMADRFGGPALLDPYRLAQDSVAAGLGAELAPAWYFVVGAPAPKVLPAGAVPQGPGVLLEELLLAALRIDDQAAIRRTVPAYVTWLASLDMDTAAIASADNVIVDGRSFRLFGAAEPVAGGVVGQLARFVRRSLEMGSRFPWPADPQELTARLASMAGITVREQYFVAYSNVEPVGSAEQLATIARLSQELADANERASWFESQLDGIRRSRPYRIGHAVLNPARVILKRARRAARSLRGR